jgi:non-homologous end joining protein Ku
VNSTSINKAVSPRQDALRAVIEKKGRPVRPSQAVETSEKVVDLMEALKKSLAAPAKPRAANRNKPGGGRKRAA